MQVLRDALRSADLPYGPVLTIGNYDGIHLGQRKVLEKVVERAKARSTEAAVVTFDPHPVSVLRPSEAPPRLTLDRQREALLEEIGIDVLLIVRFTPEVARMSAEGFVRRFLHGAMSVEEIYVGDDFVFGRERGGDVADLQRLGETLGFVAEGVDEATLGGDVISATRIRAAVAAGDAALAMDMLGRPYSLCGTVVQGDRMGARLGWPTINLRPENEHLPHDGVYCGQVRFAHIPGAYDCVTNIGQRPTVYENYQRVVESHILDFHTDVYGEDVEVFFHKRLREEKLFPSVMDLSAQIARDVETAREYFAARARRDQNSV